MGVDLPAVVVQAAADQYRLYGWTFPTPRVEIITDEGAGVIAGAYGLPAIAGAANPGIIYLTKVSAMEFRILGRVLAKPTVTARLNAWRSCGLVCVDAVALALHETAHLVQFDTGSIYRSEGWQIEGYAEAVALDLHRPFLRRVLGRIPLEFGWTPPPVDEYHAWTVAVRRASAAATGGPWTAPAARWWRYRMLGEAAV